MGNKVKDVHFEKDDKVLLKISPMKDVIYYRKKTKLSSVYIRSFEILKEVESVAYRLAQPPSL